MFTEFTTQVWTPSDPSVVITDNTDFSMDGSSKKIVWTAALNETCTLSFDAVALSNYEEISFYLSQSRSLGVSGDDCFKITIDGTDYEFQPISRPGWNHMLIDCTGMGSVTTITITALIANLTLFIDYIGYRKVTHNRDIDLLQAVQNTISLDYGVSTTLSGNVAAGATSISLTSYNYVNNTSAIELDDGGGTTETVYLAKKDGTLKNPTTNAFSAGDTATVVCPVLLEDHDDTEPNPVCGIVVYDKELGSDVFSEYFKDGSAKKVYTGALGVCIYIDCSSKKKVLQLAREFDFKYGQCFRMMLDGEQISVWLDTSDFVGDVIGNNPRIAYYYKIEPQPYTIMRAVPITSITVTPESLPMTTVIG